MMNGDVVAFNADDVATAAYADAAVDVERHETDW